MITKELQDELRLQLEGERDDLRSQLERLGRKTTIKSGEDYAAGHGEYGRDIEENAMESADDAVRDEQVIHLELRLNNILAALERMDNGTYGIDEKTKKPISEERLRANPSALSAE